MNFRKLAASLACLLVIILLSSCPNGFLPDTTVPVTGVSLDKASVSLTVGDTGQLDAAVGPVNATDKSVTWSSSADTVASVSSEGLVTAKSAGSAVITAKTTDGGKTATCAVTVEASSASSVATLSYLILFRDDIDSPTPISPDFDADTVSYTSMFVIPNSVSAVSVLAAATDAGATISGAGTRDLAIGANVLSVLVTAADGITTKTYTISVERQGDPLLENVYLSSLTASGLSIDFDKTIDDYTVNAPYELTTTTIAAAPEFSGSTLEYKVGSDLYTPPDYMAFDGSEEVVLAEDEVTKVWVKVTAANGVFYLWYTISITREEAQISTDATLSALTIHESNGSGPVVALDPVFDAATLTYDMTVDNSVTVAWISANPSDGAAEVVGAGSRSLSVGVNALSVEVTAADGVTTKVYTLNVTRLGLSMLTITSPAAGALILVGTTVTVTGTYLDPNNNIDYIGGQLGWALDGSSSYVGGVFTMDIDTSAYNLTNGPKELTVVSSSNSGNDPFACTSITVSMTGGVSGHKVPLVVVLPDGLTATSGYMSVVTSGPMVLIADIPLASATFPYTVNVEGLPDEEGLELYVIIGDGTGPEMAMSLVPMRYMGTTDPITIAGVDLDPITVIVAAP